MAPLVVALAAAASAQPVAEVLDATPGVRFARPVGVEISPGDGQRLFVLEQGSSRQPPRVLTLVPGDAAATVFLDLSDRAFAGGEAGLLGLAFHPGYLENGRVFVSYTARVAAPVPNERVFVSRVSEFARSATDGLQADPASEHVLLRVDQPSTNHNGGTVRFGPDGYLYLGLGDGGGNGDPYGNGQDLTTLLGAILRLDVDDVPEGQTYGIPPGNPFANADGQQRPEIYAYGFRNPFKFSVSLEGLWVGDVGNERYEEVDRVEAGGNYGWGKVEGPACYPTVGSCDLSAYAPPVLWYEHPLVNDRPQSRSVTGGYVFTGFDTNLSRHYLYGDFSTGEMWAYDVENGGTPTLLFDRVATGGGAPQRIGIASIDDGQWSVLVTDYFSGTIYELFPGATALEAPPEATLAVSLAGANPFRTRTALAVRARGPVRLTLVDALGREVALLWDGPAPDRVDVDGARLAPGVYTVVARGSGGRASLRIVRLP